MLLLVVLFTSFIHMCFSEIKICNVISLCRGLVFLLHGLNEHRSVYQLWKSCCGCNFDLHVYRIKNSTFINSGRYDDFAKKLNANGYKVYGIDWTGKVFSVHVLEIYSFLFLIIHRFWCLLFISFPYFFVNGFSYATWCVMSFSFFFFGCY